jgi:oxygen-independent coproporphyrinogen-3 oxidase
LTQVNAGEAAAGIVGPMAFSASELVLEPALVRKYDVPGPRYTSYPTADRFVEAFGAQDLSDWLSRRNVGGIHPPLSVYVHLPFCSSLCWYCACNKVLTRDHGRSAKYIKYLAKEMTLAAAHLPGERTEARRVSQLHWGGGTPTFLSAQELALLMRTIAAEFVLEPEAEVSIEVDPRSAPAGTMVHLAALGFNRVSLGVQDFDPEVQRAVHRIQSVEETRRVVEEARASGFRSVNLDLIYGLPKSSAKSFAATLEAVLALAPERIALYNYAHLPQLFPHQRRIREEDLPTAEEKLEILALAIGRLTRAGYVYIGMDHFAKPEDELAVAQAQGRLQRNFQGYSTQPEADMLGFGVSAIGRVGPTYYQNMKALAEYYERLDAGQLPVLRGLELSADDLVRRAVIQALICNFRLSIEAIELAWLVDFRRYFAPELAELATMEEEGLVEIQPDWIVVTARGRLLVRAICAVFDRYLRQRRSRANYSRVI